ncbi:MAG TPA: SDR family oxidoreductase [Candidatus Lokiarchaeia archaeon]|nr:SDR family oxidoreductase [Candidatus Lokiarchaeia archaeon]
MESTLILIAGATGGVGQWVVRHLIASGKLVRVLVRSLEVAGELFGDDVEIMGGDVTDPASLPPAMENVSVVISAIGSRMSEGMSTPEHVDYEGVRNLVDAAVNAGVSRFLLVSSCQVTHPENPLNRFGRVLDWKFQGEEYLRNSGLQYTIVRPGGLNDEPGGQAAIEFRQGDKRSGMISREDIAIILCQAAESPYTINKTFEVVWGRGPPLRDWDVLFKKLQ